MIGAHHQNPCLLITASTAYHVPSQHSFCPISKSCLTNMRQINDTDLAIRKQGFHDTKISQQRLSNNDFKQKNRKLERSLLHKETRHPRNTEVCNARIAWRESFQERKQSVMQGNPKKLSMEASAVRHFMEDSFRQMHGKAMTIFLNRHKITLN